jgi:transposase
MGCRLRIFLTTAENRTLKELRKAQSVPQRTQDRAQVLLLNARGWKNHQIAEYLDWTERTVRQTIHRWQAQGLVGLFDAARPGRKPRWQEEDIAYLEESLQREQRTYNSRQLAEKLQCDRQIQLSPDRIRRVLKKKGRVWKRTRASHRHKQNPTEKLIKQADLELLKIAQAEGLIYLKYLDESG